MRNSTSSANARESGYEPSEENRVRVEMRYRVIEPVLNPHNFKGIWVRNRNSRVKVIDWLARRHKVSRRSIYNWLARWKMGGEAGLARASRSDKGKPRRLNSAAREFLLTCAASSERSHARCTIRAFYRAYCDEQIRRGIRAELTCQLAAVSYSTFRQWFKRGAHLQRPARLHLITSRESD